VTDNTEDQKRQYGIALVQTQGDAYKAALLIFGNDIPRALCVSREWPNDPAVQGVLAAEAENPELFPSKLTRLWEVLAIARSVGVEAKDRLKAYDMISEMLEEKPKAPGTTINNNTLVDNRKVMVVTDHGSDDDWSEKLRRQQAALVNDARSIN